MRTAFSVGLVLIVESIFAQPQIEFEKKKIKHDKVEVGEVLSFDFLYTNAGDQPLIINETKVHCKCTIVDYPKRPTLPGKSDTLHVTFDTNNKIGWQYRDVVVHSNAAITPNTVQFIVKVLTR